MKLDSVFTGFNISAAGLTAQRKKMNAIASNLANIETSKTDAGGPYRRKLVSFSAKSAQVFSSVLQQTGLKLSTTQEGHLTSTGFSTTSESTVPAGIDTKEQEDSSAPRMVYDPTNPEADGNGYVAMPNVNVVTEMVDMIATSRAFEANTSAISAAKTMAKDSLEI